MDKLDGDTDQNDCDWDLFVRTGHCGRWNHFHIEDFRSFDINLLYTGCDKYFNWDRKTDPVSNLYVQTWMNFKWSKIRLSIKQWIF